MTFIDEATPLLHQLAKPRLGALNLSDTTEDEFDTSGWYDIVLVNMDLNSQRAVHHPYHLSMPSPLRLSSAI